MVITPITDRLISLSFFSPELQYGRLVPYIKESNDRQETDTQGNIWLYRDYKKIGTLVGPNQTHLYKLSTDRPQPLQAISQAVSDYYLVARGQGKEQNVCISKIGLKIKPVDVVWTQNGLVTQTEQTIYLSLESPLEPNREYRLRLPSQLHRRVLSFTYLPRRRISPAIRVNQLGFRVHSPSKTAFLSLWAGSLGGIDFPAKTGFELIDEATQASVFSGYITTRKKAEDDNEDAFNRNYSGATVYLVDFSKFQRTGRYHLYIHGVGRSPSFVVRNNIWNHPLYLALRAFYHQRGDIAVGPPFSSFSRPATVGVKKGLPLLTSNARLMDTGNGFLEGQDNFSELIKQSTTVPLTGIWGGYHDAGDWDRRIQHLSVTRNLFDLYQQFPVFFNHFHLNIPESSNTLPDIIDEALWPLEFFSRLQDKEGAVRGGFEATGHPYFGEPSWLERHTRLAYRPGIWSTYLFAATAAQAATTLKQLDPVTARVYEQKAVAAMKKAEDMRLRGPIPAIPVNDARNLAAIQLFRLTKNQLWQKIFEETTAFTQPGAPLSRDNQYEQADAAWAYLQLSPANGKLDIKSNCRQAIISRADALVKAQQKAGYGWMKNPWRPPFAGAFTIPSTRDVIRAWLLTGKTRYLKAIIFSLQFSFGANPQNLCFTTGVGTHPVVHPFYPDARITRQQAPAGITVLGPLDLSVIPEAAGELKQSYGASCFPDLKLWPALETFFDLYWFPQMNEFSIETMARQVYSLGFLAAFPTKDKHSRNLNIR